MRFNRAFCMPDRYTFRMKPVAELLDRYQVDPKRAADPFCGLSERAYWRCDLAPRPGDAGMRMDAIRYLDHLITNTVEVDLVFLDPPYSPRQIKEVYEAVGLEVSQTDTQNARLYSECRKRMDKILTPNGIAISCGWNSTGFGRQELGGAIHQYTIEEILLVNHGGAHHDTIVMVERKKP